MKQGYDGLSCLYNYIYDIFVCGFTYIRSYVTVNYICPMIITKLILFYHGGSDALFSFLFFYYLLMLLTTDMNLTNRYFLVLNYVLQVTVIK